MPGEKPVERVTTTIRVPRHIWKALRQMAEARSSELGGKPNVSATIADLVEEKVKGKKP